MLNDKMMNEILRSVRRLKYLGLRTSEVVSVCCTSWNAC